MSNVATEYVQMVYSDPHWDELRKENEVLKSSVSALKDAIETQIYHFEAQMNNEDCGPWYEAVQDAKKLISDASINSAVLREVTPQEAARKLWEEYQRVDSWPLQTAEGAHGAKCAIRGVAAILGVYSQFCAQEGQSDE